MAAYIGFQPNDYYNTKLYTGDGTAIGSGGQPITGVGFQSDLTWIKNRASPGTQGHQLFDAVRGATNVIWPEDPGAQATRAESLASWQSDGFTLGSDGDVNYNSSTYASWNWKAGTTSGISGGSITPTGYSLSTTAGQSIIAYSGTGSTATVPHGLGATPGMIIVKRVNGSFGWVVYHHKNTSAPETDYLMLNTNVATDDDVNVWNDTAPTSSVFTVKTSNMNNSGSGTYVAYCFTSIKGYSKFGSYRGNAAADGPFVYTGFRPAFLTIKNSESVQAWNTFDDKRSTSTKNPANFLLQPNDAAAESTGVDGVKTIDFLANGFKVRGLNNEINKNSDTHIYMAFAEFPFVSSNSKPGTAR